MAFSDGKSSGKLTGARLSFSLPLFLSIAPQNANNESSGVQNMLFIHLTVDEYRHAYTKYIVHIVFQAA